MPNYRRNYVPGGTYFFTIVTYKRRPFLTGELARNCLRNAVDKIRQKLPFEMVAVVLLPDHWHTVWSLPRRDNAYSSRIRQIKEAFTREYLAKGGSELHQSASRTKHGMRGVWQKRFWEHTIDNEDDLKRCVDYTHWNPKKHGLVSAVKDWQWSSFHRFVTAGEYSHDWGRSDPAPGFDAAEWE
jgi:putative transposase